MRRSALPLLSACALLLEGCDLSQQQQAAGDTVNSWPDAYQGPDYGDMTAPDPDASVDLPQSDDPLVQQMYLTALSCGTVNASTVPAHWSAAMVTASGCTAMMPKDWATVGQVDQLQIVDGAARSAGWFLTTGLTPGTQWTPAKAAQALYDSLGGTSAKQHYINEYELLGMYVGDVVFSFDNGGTPAAAFMRVYVGDPNFLLQSTSLTYIGFFLPQTQLQVHMCTLLQIDASVKCPGGGSSSGCWDADCSESCKNAGYSAGQCNGDQCNCF